MMGCSGAVSSLGAMGTTVRASSCSAGNIWGKLQRHKLLGKRKMQEALQGASYILTTLRDDSFLTTACTEVCGLAWASTGSPGDVQCQGMCSASVFRAQQGPCLFPVAGIGLGFVLQPKSLTLC